MSFSDLSLELRNIVYHQLLCLPDGVHLQHVDWERRMRKFKTDVFSNIHRGSDNNEDDENDDVDVGMKPNEVEEWDEIEMIDRWEERWEMSKLDLSAITPLPTAIFYGSKQIREEASEVFYGFNRFTFLVLRFIS